MEYFDQNLLFDIDYSRIHDQNESVDFTQDYPELGLTPRNSAPKHRIQSADRKAE